MLSLAGNAIGRRGADCLANALRSFNQTLLALDLSGEWVGGRGWRWGVVLDDGGANVRR